MLTSSQGFFLLLFLFFKDFFFLRAFSFFHCGNIFSYLPSPKERGKERKVGIS